MLSTWIQNKKDEEGFTLIELLVVVIIIGILAAIAIPVFLNQRESAWERTATADARNAAIQLETALTRTGEYPPTATELDNFLGETPIWNVVDPDAADTDVLIEKAADATAGDVIAEIAVSNGVKLEYELVADNRYQISAYHTELGGEDTEAGEPTGSKTAVAFYDSAEGGIVDELTEVS